MIVYIILLLTLLITALIFLFNRKTKNKIQFAIFAFLQLFFIAGFRSYDVGVDAEAYIGLFNVLKGMSFNQIMDFEIYYEKGYMILNHIIQYFTLNDQSILITTSFIIISSIIVLIYKYSEEMFLSVYLFITLTFYYSSMNIIRQYVAMAILTYSISFVKKRKIIPFTLIVFIASLFHSTALIFLIVYLFPLFKFSYKKTLITISATTIITIFLFPIIGFILTKIPQYQEHIGYLGSNKLASILKTAVLLCIFLFGLSFKYHEHEKPDKICKINTITEFEDMSKEIVIKNSDENIFSFMILIATMISLVSIRMSILGRVSEYFALYSIIYIPNVINKIKSNNIKNLVVFVVVLFALLYNAVIFIYRPEWYQVTPYNFFK